MTQGPLPATVSRKQTTAAALTPTAQAPLLQDFAGALLTGQGLLVTKNITAATLLRAAPNAPGRICRISVIVAGSAAGTVNDVLTTGAAAVANQLATIPNTVGVISIDMPCVLGMVIVPGTGQTLAVSFM